MKWFTILLLSLLIFTGQKIRAEEYNNIAVQGKVQNPTSRQIRVVLYSYVPGENHMASTAELDNENSFHFVSYINEPVFGRIYYGRESIPLYLEPGYNLTLSFEAGRLQESVHFTGVGAPNNLFLVDRGLQPGTGNPDLQEKIKESAEKEFKEWALNRRKVQLELLNSRRSGLSSGFVRLQQADIEYSWANEMFAYARNEEEQPGKKRLSADFFLFMDEVKLHNYEIIVLQSYRDFLENYLLHHYGLIKESMPKDSKLYYTNMYKVARKSLRSLPMYHMQAFYLVKALNYLGIDYVTDEYIEFANECPNQVYKNVLHQMVKGQTISPKEPEIIFTDKRGLTVPLKELKGKIVLVRFINDVNDTIHQQMQQHDQELQKRLTSYKDVRFLELPMDHNQEAFEKMVYADATEYLKSIMNRPKPGQDKPKEPAFSYILLNREGLVVSNSLDDPHNELAMEKIDALLQQEKRSSAAVE